MPTICVLWVVEWSWSTVQHVFSLHCGTLVSKMSLTYQDISGMRQVIDMKITLQLVCNFFLGISWSSFRWGRLSWGWNVFSIKSYFFNFFNNNIVDFFLGRRILLLCSVSWILFSLIFILLTAGCIFVYVSFLIVFFMRLQLVLGQALWVNWLLLVELCCQEYCCLS